MVTAEAINDIIYKHDPIQLASMGAPPDEYMHEAKMLYEALCDDIVQVSLIQQALYVGMCDAFSQDIAGTVDKYAEIANDIFALYEFTSELRCPICVRLLGDVNVQDHHLIPKELGGKETIPVHKMCHQKIHATFTNRELLHKYHTVDAIRSHPEMVKFIDWIKHKSPSFYLKNDDTAARHRQR
jgi:hypothetical protein